jgi:hypothetical protein
MCQFVNRFIANILSGSHRWEPDQKIWVKMPRNDDKGERWEDDKGKA